MSVSLLNQITIFRDVYFEEIIKGFRIRQCCYAEAYCLAHSRINSYR